MKRTVRAALLSPDMDPPILPALSRVSQHHQTQRKRKISATHPAKSAFVIAFGRELGTRRRRSRATWAHSTVRDLTRIAGGGRRTMVKQAFAPCGRVRPGEVLHAPDDKGPDHHSNRDPRAARAAAVHRG